MLNFKATGIGGHTVARFEGDRILVDFHKTSPSERGMISRLVEKGLLKGLKLHHAEKGVVGEPIEAITDVILDKKGQVALVGAKEVVEELAAALVEAEIKGGRVVAKAKDDGTWKVLELGEFKPKADEEQHVTSHAPAGGG